MRPQIFVTRTIDPAGIELLRPIGDVEVWQLDHVIPRSTLLEKIRGKDAVLTLLTDVVDREFFEAAGPNLKVVANHAIGYDNVDIEEAARRGVVITNTPALSAKYVAEHALALALAVGRRIVEGDFSVRSGGYRSWDPLAFLGQTLWGRTLGIIGCGQIGSKLAELANQSFGMAVIYCDIVRNDRLESSIGAQLLKLESVLGQADVVSVHVPLLASTRHLISQRELALMKSSAILVNTSRGPVVDEAALYRVLREGRIFGAGLDVFEHEPAIYPGLELLHNVVLTPHIASATPEARRSMSITAANNIAAVLTGRPPINPVGDSLPA